MRCPGCWHLTLLPYLQAAQTPRIIIGALLLGGLLCVVAIGVIETKHLATRNTGMFTDHKLNVMFSLASVCSQGGQGISGPVSFQGGRVSLVPCPFWGLGIPGTRSLLGVKVSRG